MQNTGSKEPLQSFAGSVDSVESFTGIDFFPLLPDDQEKLIEKTLALNSWNWKSTSTGEPKEKALTSVQCNGTTKAGSRCKNKTLSLSGYCHLHENQAYGAAPKAEKAPTAKSVQTVKATNTGSEMQTGPRGGQYYYNSSGKKVYTKRK